MSDIAQFPMSLGRGVGETEKMEEWVFVLF